MRSYTLLLTIAGCFVCFCFGYYISYASFTIANTEKNIALEKKLENLEDYFEETLTRLSQKNEELIKKLAESIPKIESSAQSTVTELAKLSSSISTFTNTSTNVSHLATTTYVPLPSVCIVTLFAREPGKTRDKDTVEVFRLGMLSLLMYSHRQVYPYYFYHDQSDLDTTRHPVWSKMPLIEKYLKHYKWVMWLDADSFIMNTTFRLEQWLDDKYDIVIAKDGVAGMNMGVFFIQSTEWSFWFMKYLKSDEAYLSHKDHVHREQRAMLDWLSAHPDVESKRVKYIHQREFNQYFNLWQGGEFLLHIPGIHQRERLEILHQNPRKFFNHSIEDNHFKFPDFALRMEDRVADTPY